MITAGSVKVPLSELAAIKTIVSPREITRRNQSRTCYIYGMVSAKSAFDQVVKEAGDITESCCTASRLQNGIYRGGA